MEANEVKHWLKKIINQRNALLRMNKCKRNALLMANITSRLTNLLNAYPYDDDKIFAFVWRNYCDILLIIPGHGNKSEAKNLQYLTQVALWHEKLERQKKCSESTSVPQSHTQLL